MGLNIIIEDIKADDTKADDIKVKADDTKQAHYHVTSIFVVMIAVNYCN